MHSKFGVQNVYPFVVVCLVAATTKQLSKMEEIQNVLESVC